jgi:polygalacturonase
MSQNLRVRFCFVIAFATLFAAAVAAAGVRDTRYVVTDHGAIGDGTTVNTQALQAVIDRCAAEGGGVIVVPAGTFLSGALFFKPGVDLLVEKDAVLKSTIVLADFPPVYTRWEGIERYWTAAFLNFVGLKNVTVSGAGTIDGSGDAWAGFGRRLPRGPKAQPGTKSAAARRAVSSPLPPVAPSTPEIADPVGPADGRVDSLPSPPDARSTTGPTNSEFSAAPAEPLPLPEEVYPRPLPTPATLNFAPDPVHLPPVNAAGFALPRDRLGSPLSPPRALVFQNCTGVRVSGLTVKNPARWGYVFLYCENVVAENLTVRAEHYIPSSDSMDIDSCRHVRVTGCDFDCNDDCLSIKAGKDEDGRRVARPSEDIVIEQTHFGYGHGGVAMGSEVTGGIRNVEVRQCVMEADNWAPIRFKSQPSRGGVVENITYRDIELHDTRQMVEFDLEWNMRINVAGDARVATTVRHVKIINVTGTVGKVGVIHGLQDSLIDGVVFENCAITAQHGLRIDHARHIDLSGLKLDVQEGEPVTRTDAE